MTVKKSPAAAAAKFIESLNMNGLEGRMMHLPAKSAGKKDILLIYDHHSSLELWYEYAKLLNKYGSVTMPDLPGFGGMGALSRINEKPSLNNLADYLAAFIKLRYRKRQIVIVAAGFGFVVTTRMLMRYPNIAKKVDMVVSLNGFTHADDIKLSKGKRRRLLFKNRLRFGFPPLAKRVVYSKNAMHNMYRKRRLVKRYINENLLFTERPFDEDLHLWRINDARTHSKALTSMLKLDNCSKRLEPSVWHVPLPANYLNEHNAEQHLRVAYRIVHVVKPHIAKKNAKAGLTPAGMLPAKLRRELSKN